MIKYFYKKRVYLDMYEMEKNNLLKHLNFEDFIWIIFISISILNIIGNYNQKNT